MLRSIRPPSIGSSRRESLRIAGRSALRSSSRAIPRRSSCSVQLGARALSMACKSVRARLASLGSRCSSAAWKIRPNRSICSLHSTSICRKRFTTTSARSFRRSRERISVRIVARGVRTSWVIASSKFRSPWLGASGGRSAWMGCSISPGAVPVSRSVRRGQNCSDQAALLCREPIDSSALRSCSACAGDWCSSRPPSCTRTSLSVAGSQRISS